MGKIDISFDNVLYKVDKLLSKDEFLEAERVLTYWQQEARIVNDKRNLLSIDNELIGMYRKQNNKTKGLCVINEALNLLKELQLEDSENYGTVLINMATAYKVFLMFDESEKFFLLAEKSYNKNLKQNDKRFGALYNNLGSLYTAKNELGKARECYNKALVIDRQNTDYELEQAITILNILDTYDPTDESNEKMIDAKINEAFELFNAPNLKRDSYYSFVCKKCASCFGYNGYFLLEQELLKRAEEIDKRK